MKNEKSTILFNVLKDGAQIHSFTKRYVVRMDKNTRTNYIVFRGQKLFPETINSLLTVNLTSDEYNNLTSKVEHSSAD